MIRNLLITVTEAMCQYQYDSVIVSKDSLSFYTKWFGKPGVAIEAICKALSLYFDWVDENQLTYVESNSTNIGEESLRKGCFLGDLIQTLKHPWHYIKGKVENINEDSINEAVNKVILCELK